MWPRLEKKEEYKSTLQKDKKVKTENRKKNEMQRNEIKWIGKRRLELKKKVEKGLKSMWPDNEKKPFLRPSYKIAVKIKRKKKK